MAEIRNPYRERLALVAAAVADLETGAASAVITGTTYTATDLPTLRIENDLLSVKAAIFAIENGSQTFSVAGRTFQKGDLAELYRRRDELEVRSTTDARGGIRMRGVVPAW